MPSALPRGKEAGRKKIGALLLGLVLAVTLAVTGVRSASAAYIVQGKTVYVGATLVSWTDFTIDHTIGGLYQYQTGFHAVTFTLWNKALAKPQDRGTYGSMTGTSMKQVWVDAPGGQGYYWPKRTTDVSNAETERTKSVSYPGLRKSVKAGWWPVGYSVWDCKTSGKVCYDVWLGFDKCTATYTW